MNQSPECKAPLAWVSAWHEKSLAAWGKTHACSESTVCAYIVYSAIYGLKKPPDEQAGLAAAAKRFQAVSITGTKPAYAMKL
jgi:hypothetical protein